MRFITVCLLAVILASTTAQVLRGRKFPSRGRFREQNAGSNDIRDKSPAPAPKPKSKPTTAVATSEHNCEEKACPNGFSGLDGLCYKVQKFSTPVTIEQAQKRCQSERATLASAKSTKIHRFITDLVKPHLIESVDSKYRRAFVGLMCRDQCDNPSNWIYADGSTCAGNNFCDWQKSGSGNQWNSVPTALYGATLAAILDNTPDTNYNHKLQSYPADHNLQFAVCQRAADSMDHVKPNQLSVNERLSNVVLTWTRPPCAGEISNYIFVLLGGTTSYDREIKCADAQCSFELSPKDCDYCILPNTDYTFSIAAVLTNAQLGPAVTVSKQIDVETCPNFETPFHTVSTCRGVSELIQDGSCDPKVTWSKGSMCGVACETGFGFYVEPAAKYSCDQGGLWAPAGRAPDCYEIVPVFSANLQFKIGYKRPNIESLQHQFDGLVYKYNDIFCPYPEECGIGDIQIKSALAADGAQQSEVIITIDTPVYNITDQAGFIDLVEEAVNTVNEDNAFMTLIDYDNIELVLPTINKKNTYKASPMLCCHKCPEGHAYKLGNCVQCPSPQDCL